MRYTFCNNVRFSRLLAFLGLTSSLMFANVIRVPTDQVSIQAAINAALIGDTVQVAPGTYYENIDFSGKAITVVSEQGAQVTIIDGQARDAVVKFITAEGRNSVLNGFTLRNGLSTFSTPGFGNGGGIWIRNSSPTVQNNLIQSNQACVGPGIMVNGGSPLIQGNGIRNNTQYGCSGGVGGGGISLLGGPAAEIRNNTIEQNQLTSANGAGISMFGAGSPIISANIIRQNTATGLSPCTQGGGISMVNQSDALVVNNLITGNSAGCGGGVYWLVPSGDRGPFLINNTIADNFANQGAAVYASGFQAQTQLINNILVSPGASTTLYCDPTYGPPPPILNSNDVFTTSGTAYTGICAGLAGSNGNISADPMFAGATNGDYHLLNGSLAIDSGTSTQAPTTDLEGSPRPQDGNGDGIAAFDMGAYETHGPTDRTPPVTIAAASPLTNASGWNKSTVTVTLNATDNTGGSGVKQIQYSLSGAQNLGPVVMPGNSTSVSITTEGTTVLSYFAVDNAGNTETVHALSIAIDETAPTIAGMPAPDCTLAPAKHQLVQVAVVTASDAGSGVSSLKVTATSNQPDSGTGGGDVPGDIVINGGTVQLRAELSPGTKSRIYTINASATDFAGNTKTATATCVVPK
jgi:parallel beta-helix repeat protein